MNIWSNAVITTKGLALQAKLIEGNTLKITRAAAGAGSVTPGLLQAQTAVKDERQALSIRSYVYPEPGKCAVTASLNNDTLETGYTAMQIGFYAEDPDEGEILYFIAQAAAGTGVIIPSKDESTSFSADWKFYFQYGNASSVSITVDPAGAVSQEAMEIFVQQFFDENLVRISEEEIDTAFHEAFGG